MIIPQKLIEETWKSVSMTETQKEAKAISNDFLEKQPVLAAFVVNYLKTNTDDQTADLGYYIAMVIWRIFSKSTKGRFEELTEKYIKSIYEKNEEIFHSLARKNELSIENFLSHQNVYTQPHVLQYMIEAIYMEEDDHQLNPQQQTYLFRCLKIVVDALSESYYLQTAKPAF
ncbi:MAG: hypothetical protein BroJett040_11930 [Oligoflexia bacterium]|nr:MAG: hypothetical protein BroJett040_11930 [Oligoflexia bacterium]